MNPFDKMPFSTARKERGILTTFLARLRRFERCTVLSMERSAVPKPRIPKIIKVLKRARRIYSPGAPHLQSMCPVSVRGGRRDAAPTQTRMLEHLIQKTE